MDTAAPEPAQEPTVPQVACPTTNSVHDYDSPAPATELPHASALPEENENGGPESMGSSDPGVTEIVTSSSGAVITRTAPSLASSSESQIPGDTISTSHPVKNVCNGSLIPPTDPSSHSQKQTREATSHNEPIIQLRTSHSFKRDSGLAVGESPTSTSPSPVFAVSAAVPTNSAAAATSPPPRYIRRYAPSLVGAASIGGVSVAPSILTPEDEVASQRVRSLYDSGSDRQSSYSRRGADSDAGSMVVPGGRTKRLSKGIRNSWVITDEEGELAPEMTTRALREEEEGESSNAEIMEEHITSESGQRDSSLEMPEPEAALLAGGVEDWENIDGNDVDR